MTEPADIAVRKEALDVSRSFIVQAPAGSGKTELLTQRYLALLATVSRPEEVLAITFTRKAAGEMRHRVLQALDAAGEDPPAGAGAHERERHAMACAVMHRSRELGWALEVNPGRLQISTLDALDRKLATRLPVLAGGLGGASIAERPGHLYEEAARRALLEGGPEPTHQEAGLALIAHLDGRFDRAVDLLAQLLERRDRWAGHLPDDVELARADLERGLRAAVDWAIASAAAATPREHLDALAIAAAAASDQADLDPASPVMACAELAGPPPTDADHAAAWRGMGELITTKAGELRKKLTARDGVPKDHDSYRPANAALAYLHQDREAREAWLRLRSLPDPAYSEESWTALAPLPRLLRLALAHLHLVFEERGEVDYTAVSQAALEALLDEHGATELALAMDHKLSHLLVDEFQDTSQRQLALLEALTGGWSAGDGRTLFCVGDPMQSIYRFREAEVGLFLRVWQHGLPQVAMTPLRLSANFRSVPPVVEWVNHRFRDLLADSDDPVLGRVSHSDSVAARSGGDPDAVRWMLAPGASAAALGERVAARIAELRREEPETRVGVLVQNRDHLSDAMNAMRDLGLRPQAVKIQRLGGRPVVAEIVNLLFALTDTSDRLAWAGVLRGRCCGLEPVDLERLCRGRGSCIPDALTDPTILVTLSDTGRRRVERVAPVLEAGLEQRGTRGLRAWLESVWLALGGAAACNDAAELEDARAALDLIGRHGDGDDVPDRPSLERALEDLYASPDPEADPALQVMTIHAAKGLQFDHVFLLLAGRAGRGDERPLLHRLELPDTGDVLLAPVEARGAEPDPIHNFVSEVERARARWELGRLLYVATTRAREGLTLAARPELKTSEDGARLLKPHRGSLLELLWSEAEPLAEAAIPDSTDGDGAGTARSQQLERLPEQVRLPEPPPALLASEGPAVEIGAPVEFSWAGETARHVGTLTHRLLERCAVEGASPPARHEVALELARAGVPTDRREQAVARVLEAMERTLADPTGRWLLDPARTDARSELALSGILDGRLVDRVVDRSFVDDEGRRWIVDYKLSSHEGGDLDRFLERERERYRDQLTEYGRLFEALDGREQVRALYLPLMGELIVIA